MPDSNPWHQRHPARQITVHVVQVSLVEERACHVSGAIKLIAGEIEVSGDLPGDNRPKRSAVTDRMSRVGDRTFVPSLTYELLFFLAFGFARTNFAGAVTGFAGFAAGTAFFGTAFFLMANRASLSVEWTCGKGKGTNGAPVRQR
jgi:hypothetical protein